MRLGAIMKSETKLKKIKEIVDEIPTVYATFDFHESVYVREGAHQYLIGEIKKIKKILESK